MSDDNIIDWSEKRREAERAPRPGSEPIKLTVAERIAKPVLIACHCTGTLFEILAGGKLRCARCHCLLSATWKFES